LWAAYARAERGDLRHSGHVTLAGLIFGCCKLTFPKSEPYKSRPPDHVCLNNHTRSGEPVLVGGVRARRTCEVAGRGVLTFDVSIVKREVETESTESTELQNQLNHQSTAQNHQNQVKNRLKLTWCGRGNLLFLRKLFCLRGTYSCGRRTRAPSVGI
jgi:hypothetical protein